MKRKTLLNSLAISAILVPLLILAVHAEDTQTGVTIQDHYCQDSRCNIGETRLNCPVDCTIGLGKTTNFTVQLFTANMTGVGSSDEGALLNITATDDQVFFLNVTLQADDPVSSIPENYSELKKYLILGHNETAKMSDTTIKIHYTDSEISSRSLDESTLVIGYYNATGNATNGTWVILPSTVDTSDNYVSATVTHFSTFGVFGVHKDQSTPPVKSGGGTSRTFIIDQTVEKPEGAILSTPIDVELYPGRKDTASVYLKNTLDHSVSVSVDVTGDAAGIVSFGSSDFNLNANKSRNLEITVEPGKDVKPGEYDGEIEIHIGTFLATIPLNIKVLSPEERTLRVKLTQLADKAIGAGDTLPVAVDLSDLNGIGSMDVYLTLQLVDPLNITAVEEKEHLSLSASTSLARKLKIPGDAAGGPYTIRAIVHYLNQYYDKIVTATVPITVNQSIGSQITSAILPFFLVMMLLSAMLSRRPLNTRSESGVMSIRNTNLFNRRFSSLMVVCDNTLAPDKAGLVIDNQMTGFTKYSGNVRDFFKTALTSGPIFTQYGKKTIYVIKDSDAKFLTLDPRKEIRIMSLGIARTNSRVYSLVRGKGQNLASESNTWSVLEDRNLSDPVEYFSELQAALKKVKVEGTPHLRRYLRNIISILR